MAEERGVCDILARLGRAASHRGRVSIGHVAQAVGSRGYGAFLLVPALIELTPVGGIPGVPTVLASIIILFAAQMVFGRRHLWLPRLLARRSLSEERLAKAVDKMKPVGQWLDRWFHGRLTVLTNGPFARMAAALCIVLALTVPPLEFLPFASSGPMAAIAMFGLALLVRDGALMIAASLLAGGAAFVVIGVV